MKEKTGYVLAGLIILFLLLSIVVGFGYQAWLASKFYAYLPSGGTYDEPKYNECYRAELYWEGPENQGVEPEKVSLEFKQEAGLNDINVFLESIGLKPLEEIPETRQMTILVKKGSEAFYACRLKTLQNSVLENAETIKWTKEK